MMDLTRFSHWALAAFLLCVALFLLRRVLVSLLRLLLRSSVGLAALALLSHIGPSAGIHLGVNLFNALVLGVLGVPGFGLLLMLQWTLR